MEIFFAGVRYNHHNSKMSFFDVMNNVKPYRRKPKRVFCSKCQKPFSEIRYLRQHVNQVHANLDSNEKQAIFDDCASKVRKMTPKPVKETLKKEYMKKVEQKVVKRKNPAKGKQQPRTTGTQRLNALKQHREDPKSKPAPSYQISRWKKQEADLLERPVRELRSKNYFLKKKDDRRLTGYFPKQQAKLVVRIKRRRGKGKPCSTKWIQHAM